MICMVETSPAACVFFLSVFLMGNWVCTNLLLAIFSECFAADDGDNLLQVEQGEMVDVSLPLGCAVASARGALPTRDLESAALESVESQSVEDSHCRNSTKQEALSEEERRARMLKQTLAAETVFQFFTQEGARAKKIKKLQYHGRYTPTPLHSHCSHLS